MRTTTGFGGWLSAAGLAMVLGSPAHAETAGAPEARAAFQALVQVEGSQPPSGTGPREAEERNLAEREAWRRRLEQALEKFHAAFAASDWASWPASDADAGVLERGLLDLGEAALAKQDPATAVRAFDRAALLPRPSPAGVSRIADGRPAAHLASGAPEKARALAAAATKAASGEQRPAALTRQGDVECALGRIEEARAFYRQASATAPGDGEPVFGLEAVAAREARWKLDLVGKALGTTAPEWAVGTEPGKWTAAAAGRVVVLVFPDPYQAERFDPAPYARWVDRGATVAGVLAHPMSLRLRETFLEYPRDSSPRLRGETQPVGLEGWAERLRRVAKFKFPVIGLPPEGLPLRGSVLGTALVVDAQGKVAYFKASEESPAYLAATVDRLLAPR